MPDQCPQLKKLPEHVRKFWEDKQKEFEDTLIRFSYAILIIPSQISPIQKSGILYLMKRNLWFEDFPKPALFSFIITTPQYKKTMIQMPLETLENVKVIPQSVLNELLLGKKHRSAFSQGIFRWLNPDPACLLVSGKEVSGNRFQYAFRELDDPGSWVLTLSDLSVKNHGNNPAPDSQ
jgi:hypothetical protein